MIKTYCDICGDFMESGSAIVPNHVKVQWSAAAGGSACDICRTCWAIGHAAMLRAADRRDKTVQA